MRTILSIYLFLTLLSCAGRYEEVIAEIDGYKLYASELSQITTQETFDLLNMAYEIKMRALDDLVKRKLIEIQASKQGTDVDKYLDAYVESKIKSQTMFQDNDLFSKNRLRSVLIEQLTDSLYKMAHIKRYIYPPKQPRCVIVDLCIHYRGNLNATTHFIVASDFNCKRCAEFEKTLKRIYDKYHDKVKFGFVSFADEPTYASLACEAAANQGKFWEFHDAVFAHNAFPDSTFVLGLAKNLGLDVTKFKQELLSSENYNKVNHAISTLMERGLFATPTIIINDRLIYITNSYEELTKLLDQELEE